MINLLPDDKKAEIQAARHNVLLLRYIGITLLATAALFIVIYSSHAILTQTKVSAETIIETTTVEADVYEETKNKVTGLTSQLADIQAISSQEVKFSTVLTDLAALMPAGTVIKEIDLSASSVYGPMDIVVFAKSTEALLSLQSTLQTSPMFTSVDFQSIGESDGSVSGYPSSVTMTVVLSRASL